jgi:hypothetical protein
LVAEFLPDPVIDDPLSRVRSAYPTGTVALARVESVTDAQAVVLLLPEVRAGMDADNGSGGLAGLLSPGDIIAVALTWTDEGCHAVLADPDATASLTTGVPMLPGGPPWLLPSDLVPEPEPDEESQPRSTTSDESPGTPHVPLADPADLLHHLAEARAAADRFADEADEATRALAQQTRELKRVRSDLRKAQATIRRLKNPQDPIPVYADPARQLRHESSLAYLEHVAECDRSQWPPAQDYIIGPAFVPSLTALDGIDRAKVLEVIVDVLTGRASQMSSRSVRPWKETRTGKQEVRHDGAKAYRVNLQNNTPSARRMKYWRHPDSRIELDFVGLHDDGLD